MSTSALVHEFLLVQTQHPQPRSSKFVLVSSFVLVFALLVRFWIEYQKSFGRKGKAPSEQQTKVSSYVPVFGHQLTLLSSPAEQMRIWARSSGDVFEIRLGNRKVTMINSGKAARDIYAKHSNALNSRPELWTYHNVFSHGGKTTLSTTPFNQLFANAKKAAPFSQAYMSRNLLLIDLETRRFLEECLDLKGQSVDPLRMVQRMLISVNLNMCWGRRILHHSDPLLLEILECEYKIMELRNMYTNFQDGIPIFRTGPFATKSREAVQIRRRRDAYLDMLNKELDEKMARGEAKSCLRTELLMQGDALAEELDVLSVTMLGAGVGPSAAGLHWGLALLAVRHDIQQKAYDELRRYTAMEPSMNVMNNLHDSAGCPYVHALAQEILRFFTPTRLGLPRYTTKDIYYNDQFIPQNSVVVMNGWACNRDPAYWPTDPNNFLPERWLSTDSSTKPASPQHFTFSLGARSCAGTLLANRMSYIFYARLISAFEIRLAEDCKFSGDPLADSTWYALLANPKDVGIVLVPRKESALRNELQTQRSGACSSTILEGT